MKPGALWANIRHMRALLHNPVWRLAVRDRTRQRLFGRISGLLLAIAMAALFDGLLAQMRTGHQELNILPGETIALSGPAALKNPLASDIVARFTPEGAPLRFELEGFFTGYWFGSGMWRGRIEALPGAESGRYSLRISFRGTSARNAQEYVLNIFRDGAAMRAASLSLIRRHTGYNPFMLAAVSGGLGLLLGGLTYWFGRRFTGRLHSLGLAQIYSHNAADTEIQCLAPRDLAPPAGNDRMVLAADGTVVGEARVISWQKGKLKLKLLDESVPPPDGLVCLRHPWAPDERDMLRRGKVIDIH